MPAPKNRPHQDIPCGEGVRVRDELVEGAWYKLSKAVFAPRFERGRWYEELVRVEYVRVVRIDEETFQRDRSGEFAFEIGLGNWEVCLVRISDCQETDWKQMLPPPHRP